MRVPKMRCMRCHDIMTLAAKMDVYTKLECCCRTVCLNMEEFSTTKEFSVFLKEHDMKVEK